MVKMLAAFHFSVVAAILVVLGSCKNCTIKDDIKLYDKNDSSKLICWPLPKCNDGQEASVEPGSSHPLGTKIQCIHCHADYFSNNHTNKRCRRCTSCGNNKEHSPCESSRDRHCSLSCISSAFYFNATDQQCYPCAECCGASDEDIEHQCVSMRVGTVIGGNGEKHCKASFKSSQPCSNELPSPSSEARECSCGNSSSPSELNLGGRDCRYSIDSLHIALMCGLAVLVLVIILWVSCRWYASRRNRQSPRRGYVRPPCVDVSSCAETASRISCQDKLQVIPEGLKINTLPYQVEDILVEKLDVSRHCVKNWWDVGRMLEISYSELQRLKRQENHEGGSPTECLLEVLKTWDNVISLKKFVEISHKLKRHDICNAIYEFYQTQGTAV